MSVTPTLKTNVKEIKQHDTGRVIKVNNDKCTGHVRGLILGFEMMGSGDDLKKIKELKFKESIKNPYQSPEKRIRFPGPQLAWPGRLHGNLPHHLCREGADWTPSQRGWVGRALVGEAQVHQ